MSISMLGLGSNNALNGDLIAGLKKADEAAQKSIYETRIESDNVKIENISTIKTAIEGLKESMEELGTSQNYNALSISGNDTLDIKITDASVVENFSLEVTQKARKGIMQSNTFTDMGAAITTAQTLVFSIGTGGDRTIDFPAGTTYQDMSDRLNLEQGVDVSVVKINETEFRLSISSEDTGLDNSINIKSETAELSAFMGLSDPVNVLQASQNSLFSYNGIDIERTNNEIKDLIPGVEFTITSIGNNDITVSPDAEALTSSIANMVDKYNALVEEVKGSMEVDNYRDSLQTTTEVRDIMRSINNSLFGTFNLEGSKYNNLADLGVASNKDGTISITPVKDELGNNVSLLELARYNFKDIQQLFSATDVNSNSIGIMNSTFDNVLEKMLNSSNSGSLNQLEAGLNSDVDRLNAQLEKTQAKIDAQYELMTRRFAAFDALIQTQNSAFSSLELQMKQSVASPNA